MMVMGITVMYGQSYNMFGDALMPLYFLFFLFSTLVGSRLATALGLRVRLWEKKSDADSALVRRRLKEKMQRAGTIPNKSGALSSRVGPGSGATGGDETLRSWRGSTTSRVSARGADGKKRSELQSLLRKHHHIGQQHQKEGWVKSVPEEVMTGEEMRDKFVATNRQWLLKHLPQLLDDDVVEEYRGPVHIRH